MYIAQESAQEAIHSCFEHLSSRTIRNAQEAILAQLGHREIAGYDCGTVRVACCDGSTVSALVFTANSDNPHYLGEASDDSIGKQV